MDSKGQNEILDDTTRAVSQSTLDDPIAVELGIQCGLHARQAAALLRDYRETYGLKPTLAYIFQAEAAAGFNLLRRLDTATGQARPVFLREGTSLREDVQAAFEECFRCLLGTSTQMMMARGVLRMLTQTAIHLKIRLPEAVTETVQALQTWRSTDIDRISSMYPNYAIAKDAQSRNGAQMEELLRKWEKMTVTKPGTGG